MSFASTGPGFRDRRDAGRALGQALLEHRDWRDPVVLALPRGGVPVGAEVARLLEAPLDILVVRKIGHPHHEEFAIGAIASGVTVMNPESQGMLGPAEQAGVERILARERAELQRREEVYRSGHPAEALEGRELIVVDDGLATGATMRAGVQALRARKPARITVAVPLGPRETCDALARVADSVVCVCTPEPFRAVGLWYAEFEQVGDEEVREILRSAHRHAAH
jgi:putative phosphoribosyl transferase